MNKNNLNNNSFLMNNSNKCLSMYILEMILYRCYFLLIYAPIKGYGLGCILLPGNFNDCPNASVIVCACACACVSLYA